MILTRQADMPATALPLRIALIHYSAPPVVGGVESVLAHHARLMATAGHIVKIIVGRGEAWDDAIPLIRLPLIDSRHPEALAVKAELDRGRVPPTFERLAAQIMAELQPVVQAADIVIVHNVCSLHKNLAFTAALHQLSREPGAPHFILWHHDLAWTTPRYRSELYDGLPWDLLRTASAWPGVQHVVVSALRQQELADLMSLRADGIQIVPNGIDRTGFLKLELQTQSLYEQMNIAEAEPLLLLPVRLTPRKNIELAVRALADLRRDFPKATLLVTGPEGPHNPANAEYKQQLIALRNELGLQGAAHFVAEHSSEFLPDAVVADFFRLADALILPSREEGFGIPLIEAAFSHLPVFCADIPPLRELGADDVTYFSPDAAPAQVADAIANRLQHSPVYRFGARARRDYSWEGVYARHIAPLLVS